MPLLSKSDRPARARSKRRPLSLDAPDPADRRRAVLDRAQDAGAVAELGPRLQAETDPGVRSALFTVLTEIGTPEALDTLLPCLQSEDADLRNAAIAAAQTMPAAMATRMASLLAEADADLRIFALDILQDLPHPDAPDWIAGLLARETEANVVGTAIDRLAECGRPDMVPTIRAAADRFAGVSYIRFACDFACAQLDGAAAETEGDRHAR
ncbi:MAG: HEAT repeat domain-containing protein [Rhodovulum sp.]